jgi:hypothetical protein
MFPATWLSPEFVSIITTIALVVAAVTQTIKKTIEAFIKVEIAPVISIVISVVISFIASFPHLASDGLIGYLIIVACVCLSANGIFKLAKVAAGPR